MLFLVKNWHLCEKSHLLFFSMKKIDAGKTKSLSPLLAEIQSKYADREITVPIYRLCLPLLPLHVLCHACLNKLNLLFKFPFLVLMFFGKLLVFLVTVMIIIGCVYCFKFLNIFTVLEVKHVPQSTRIRQL